jgi:peptide chain release factor subunit 1
MDQWDTFEQELGGLKCLKCDEGQYEVSDKEDLIEVIVEMAQKAEARFEIISTQTEEGEMLLRSFGGIAAITKYRTY